jgi:hypothetical protein
MRFEHVNSYPAPPAEVLRMLTDRDFRARVCVAQRARSHDVQVTGEPPAATVVVRREQSVAGAPGVVTKLTGDSVEIVQTERWSTADGADLLIEIPGKPGRLSGTITLRESASGTDEVFAGDVKVSIPLVGGKVESFLADLLARALRSEGRVGTEWLARA